MLYHLFCVLCKVTGLIFKMQGYGFGKCEFLQFAESSLGYPSKVKHLRLVGEVARRAGGVSRPRIIPHGAQMGHYDPRMAHKRVIMPPPHGAQKNHYATRMVNKWLVSLQGWTVQTYGHWANNGFENGNINKLDSRKMWMLYR